MKPSTLKPGDRLRVRGTAVELTFLRREAGDRELRLPAKCVFQDRSGIVHRVTDAFAHHHYERTTDSPPANEKGR